MGVERLCEAKTLKILAVRRGADNSPPGSRKRSNLETGGIRHWIRADDIYNFSEVILSLLKNNVAEVKKVKIAALEGKRVFFCLPITSEPVKLEEK